MNDDGRSSAARLPSNQRYADLRDQALRTAADLAGNIIEQFASRPMGTMVQV